MVEDVQVELRTRVRWDYGPLQTPVTQRLTQRYASPEEVRRLLDLPEEVENMPARNPWEPTWP